MQPKDYSRYFKKKPSSLSDAEFLHILTFFKLLNTVEKPMVSLVIPVYRAKETLTAHIFCLADLKTILPYEIIFVDNNADEETRDILHTFGAKVVKETRQGITHARQKGLESAKGDVLLSMDPDTLYEAHYIDKMAIPFFIDEKLVLNYAISKSYEEGMICSNRMNFRNFLKTLLFRLRLMQQAEKRVKFIRAACIGVRRDTLSKVGYRTDIKAVAGCDDGILAIDLLSTGTFKYVHANVYTALPPPREPGKPFPFCNEKFAILEPAIYTEHNTKENQQKVEDLN